MKFINIFLFSILSSSALMGETVAEKSFNRLVEGNQRFFTDQSEHPNRTLERKDELTSTQAPFAAILGCADSRVSPEIIFDQGIGDLFVVRVAGNVLGDTELDSLEYAILYLGATVVVVLGHENCGAVQAVLDGKTKDIEAVASLIQPAANKTQHLAGNRLQNTIIANVELTVKKLKKNPLLKGRIEGGALLVKGGYYNFHTGKVEFL